MSIERIPVFRCTTQGCPWPKNEAAHVPWCLHIEGVEHWDQPTHQHIPRKGMGGKNSASKIKAILCQPCHDKVDNTPDWDNAVTPGEEGREEYILWDTRVEGGWATPLICRATKDPTVKEVMPNETARDRMRLPNLSSLHGERVVEGVEARQGEAESSAGETETGRGIPSLVRLGPSPDGLTNQGLSSPAPPSASQPSPAAGEQLNRELPSTGVSSAPPAVEPGLALPGTITPTSLTLPQNLSLEGWARVGETLGNIHRASRFWIGDWLTFGEDTYHEKVAQSMDVTGLEFETLANIASVCRRVPASRRRESLTFGHHTEVASQEPDRQETLLAEAEEQGWSVRALREAIQGPSEPRPEPEGVCPTCGAEGKLSAFRRV